MARPDGTRQCKHPGCERGTIWTDYCRRHRKEHEGEPVAGLKLEPEVKVSFDEIVAELGREKWDAAVAKAIAKKKRVAKAKAA